MVENLVAELNQDVDTYIKTFRPQGDTQEWQFVLQEISQFLDAEQILSIDKVPAPCYRRLSLANADYSVRIKVQEAILVGNYQHQVKFSELTLDMFRIMQVS